MDTFDTDIKLTISPVFYEEYPEIKLMFDGVVKFKGALTERTVFDLTSELPVGEHIVEVHFLNKKTTDTKLDQGLDKAIVIESVTLEGMDNERFKWAGVYYPVYPDYVTDGATELPSTTYLGWNGVWILKLTSPIYTWIHQTEHLGWIVEVDKNLIAK
jgi:hypothetical protein